MKLTDARKAAEFYIQRGLQVVPLAPGSKAAISDDWLKLVFKPDDFRPEDNIGIRSVGGIVIVDVDSPEVVACAPAFLPKTGMVWGRPSKPSSKWLYRCPGLDKIIALKDLAATAPRGDDGKAREDKTSLIELRVNHQDVAPPSFHPSGEQLAWEKVDGIAWGPTDVELPPLLRAVRLSGTCGLISRYYNPKGDRHDWGVALAGTLRKLGITRDEAALIFTMAARWAHDSEVKDRLDAVRGTYDKGDDDAIAGPKALLELMPLGKEFVASLRKIWGEDSLGISRGALEQMNEKHAVVFMQNGELCVITEDKDTQGRYFLRYSSFETISKLYTQPVIVSYKGAQQDVPVYKKLGAAWLEHPKRRFYNGIELAPNGRATPGYYNLWRGFTVQPRKGTWDLFKAHIKDIISCGDEEIYSFIIDWMARCVQHPGEPAEQAIALRGGQGTGKSTFATWFGSLFGDHFLHLDSTRQLTGNFNAHLHNAIVVFADEAAWPGDKAGVGALRRMVTERTLQIERKGMDQMTVPNLIHMLLASNEDWVVPAALDERRFAVFDVSKERQNDRKYFDAIRDELFNRAGREAMLFDLLEHKLGEMRAVPKTAALTEQKQLTAGAKRQWWYQELMDGDIWHVGETNERGDVVISRDWLYDRYIDALNKAGFRSQFTGHGLKVQLGRFLDTVLPSSYPRDFRKASGQRFWVFPSLEKCRGHIEREYGTKMKWPASTPTQGELDDTGSGTQDAGDSKLH